MDFLNLPIQNCWRLNLETSPKNPMSWRHDLQPIVLFYIVLYKDANLINKWMGFWGTLKRGTRSLGTCLWSKHLVPSTVSLDLRCHEVRNFPHLPYPSTIFRPCHSSKSVEPDSQWAESSETMNPNQPLGCFPKGFAIATVKTWIWWTTNVMAIGNEMQDESLWWTV